MIGAVNLAVAVHTTSVEGEDVESGYGLMARQKIDVTLLAQLMAAPGQQAGVVGAVRCMAGETALLHRRVLPKEWPTLVRVALKTCVIG